MKHRFIARIVIVVATFCTFIHANAQTKPPTESALSAGIDALYSMRLADARAMFDSIIANNPSEPRAYLFRSLVYLWRYLFDYSTPDYAAFVAASEKAIDVAEAAMKNTNDNAAANHARMVVGLSYGFRAIANLRAENVVKGTLDARSCYNYLTDVLKRNPSEYDAYVGMGIFHFMLGAIPKNTRWLANLAGLKGDRDLGLRELQIAAEKAPFAANDAKMMLGIISVYYNNDYDKGLTYLNDLLQRYPNNIPVLYTIGNVQAYLKKLPYALEYYKRLNQVADTNFSSFVQYSSYRMGEAYFRLGDFTNAKPYLQKFLKGKMERSFRVNSLFRLALIEELEGRREQAVKGYKKATELFAIETEDQYAARKCKELAKTPMDDAQKQLWRGVNAVESLRFAEAEQTLRPLATATNNEALSKEVRAEALYHLGEAARRQQRTAEALALYQQTIDAQPEREKWLIPWSYYQMAEIAYNAGDRNRSKALLDKARAFSGYDFENWLEFALERDVTMLK